MTACNLDVPVHYPVLGENAFRTQAGVHAAAIVKARARGREDAAARVYSSVDPGIVGRVLDVEVGPASGRANVRMALERLRLTLDDAGVDALLERARVEGRVLGDEELRRLCARP